MSKAQTSRLPVIFVVNLSSLSLPPIIYFKTAAPNVVIPNSIPSIPRAPKRAEAGGEDGRPWVQVITQLRKVAEESFIYSKSEK